MQRRLAEFLRKRWLRRAVLALSALYVGSLLVVMGLFRFVGERWWASAVALYLPRFVFLLPLPFLLGALFAIGHRRAFWALLGGGGLLGFVLMGLVLPWSTGVNRSAPVIRVLSYNVNSCYGGAENVAEVIDKYSPDIVFLQELGPAEPIVAVLRSRYPTVRADTQFLVATRFPITSSYDPEKVHYNGRLRSPRWTQQVMDTPLGPIAFYNVHPLSPREGFYALRGNGLKHEILSGRLFTGANKDVLQQNSGLRALQVEDFTDAAKAETLPVVIAGDTNLPGLSYVLNHSLAGYQDGFAKAGWGLGYTFPTTRAPLFPAWMRIDRMFATAQLRFAHFEVGSSKVSDHDCIVADLQRAE
jgi:endonuclease/exonuclease/phosphatase family metal-dependent hydrolase